MYSTLQELFSEHYTLTNIYAEMYYHGIMLYGLGDIGPVNTEEQIYLSMVIIISTVFGALVLGDLTSLVQEIFRESSEL